ncbi:hypothetical protein DH09_15825 [Bacillaceae bacterium JMAK1]|nr:hypothetical protein DH09_15825 [Bacillaceae bacterium JMAK1]
MIAPYWHEETTIQEIHTAFRHGQLTSQKLVMYYLERIALYDQDGPNINAVLDVNPDAIAIAKGLDIQYAQSGLVGPLHGIPVLLKDNIQTGDALSTSAGAYALKDWKADEDAALVKKLRAAGAVILGKANMTELAHRIGREGMPNSFSSRGGLVLNPYGPHEFDVGGSSSGSAAAIASNFAVVSIGTETSGSLVNPATRNSLVTIKPTFGLVSREGVIPLSYSQDVAGPLTRTVEDAAILLDVIAGRCEQDHATHGIPTDVSNYNDHLLIDGLSRKRIGVYRGKVPDDLAIHVDEHRFEAAIDVLRKQEVEVIEGITIPDVEKEIPSLLRYEIKHSLNTFFKKAKPSTGYNNFDEFLTTYFQHARLQPYGFDSFISGTDRKEELANSEWIMQKLLNQGLHDEHAIENVMKNHALDAIVFPSAAGFAAAARAGLPSISVPAGYKANGQPFGITFTGPMFQERALIELAFGYEQATQHRKKPYLE